MNRRLVGLGRAMAFASALLALGATGCDDEFVEGGDRDPDCKCEDGNGSFGLATSAWALGSDPDDAAKSFEALVSRSPRIASPLVYGDDDGLQDLVQFEATPLKPGVTYLVFAGEYESVGTPGQAKFCARAAESSRAEQS